MEKRIFFVGILILVLGSTLFLIGSTLPGSLMLIFGAVDLVAVIFWSQLTGSVSHGKVYSLGDQVVDTILIVGGVVLTITTGNMIFLAATVGGIGALSYRKG